jgi:hypothetical protein
LFARQSLPKVATSLQAGFSSSSGLFLSNFPGIVFMHNLGLFASFTLASLGFFFKANPKTITLQKNQFSPANTCSNILF